MKKFLAVLTCFMLILSKATFAFSSSEAENAEKLLGDFISNHSDEIYPNDEKGVEDGFLADLDGDGVPELLCSRNTYFYGLSVYAVRDDAVVKMGDEIFFERGTGISENLFLVTDTKGRLMFYREAIHDPQPGEELYTTQALYTWKDEKLSCEKYLEMTVNYGQYPEKTGFTTSMSDKNGEDASFEKITKEDAREKFNSFKKEQFPHIIWEKYATEKTGFYDIWNKQKEGKTEESVASESKKTSIVLQIGNPVMTVSGMEAKFAETSDVAPVIKDGRTLVPMSGAVKALGGYVIWDEYTQSAVIIFKEKEIKIVFGENTVYVDGETRLLDVAPEMINGETAIPIRFVAEAFGFNVTWVQETSEIIIN